MPLEFKMKEIGRKEINISLGNSTNSHLKLLEDRKQQELGKEEKKREKE